MEAMSCGVVSKAPSLALGLAIALCLGGCTGPELNSPAGVTALPGFNSAVTVAALDTEATLVDTTCLQTDPPYPLEAVRLEQTGEAVVEKIMARRRVSPGRTIRRAHAHAGATQHRNQN